MKPHDDTEFDVNENQDWLELLMEQTAQNRAEREAAGETEPDIWAEAEDDAGDGDFTEAEDYAGNEAGGEDGDGAAAEFSMPLFSDEMLEEDDAPVDEELTVVYTCRPAWFVALMSALCVVLALAIVCAGFVFYVAKLDSIYPNVLLDGVYVGGATPEAAALLLESRGEEGYEGKSVTMSLPMTESMTVEAQSLGLGGTPASAAREAYRYGRSGNYFENALSYLRCYMGEGVNILWKGSLDEQRLSELVTEVSEPLNERLDSAGATITDEGVAFTKGAGAMELDSAYMMQLVGAAFAAEDYDTIAYRPDIVGEANVELENLYNEIYKAPVNASYDKETGAIVPHEQGVSFDMEVAQTLLDETENGQELFLPLVYSEPAINTDMMEEYLFRDLLSEKSTSFAGSASGRITNIKLAAAAINGLVLLPGEEFDYNLALGERTTAKGYQTAGVYENGQVSTGVGGGICQVSSTLYYCALYADLDITERVDHYFAVGYLPMGLDATVSWGGPNLRFVNDTDYPIKIYSWTSGNNVFVEIWGTNLDGHYVRVSTDGWEDANYYYAEVYRKLYDADGNLIRSDAGVYSRYNKHSAT